MKTKRILTMQDLSCVGQCSLTVALPILSRFGIETSVLPTAVLSNHTMFDGWSYLDLTDEIKNIFEYWQKNNFTFDGFLLGYLGKKQLMDIAEECFARFSNEGAPVIIDPVFGDNGKLYGGFDMQYVEAMAHLLKSADIILPNVTEACFLTGTPFKVADERAYVEEIIEKLKKLTDGIIIMTGVEIEKGKIGEAIYADGKITYVQLEKLNAAFHGTGDIFASVFAANYLKGASLEKCCELAGKFVADCMRATDKNEHFYGVNFEEILNK